MTERVASAKKDLALACWPRSATGPAAEQFESEVSKVPLHRCGGHDARSGCGPALAQDVHSGIHCETSSWGREGSPNPFWGVVLAKFDCELCRLPLCFVKKLVASAGVVFCIVEAAFIILRNNGGDGGTA